MAMIPNKMLCCSGEKESARDLKSAQNTPSRQPLQMPFTASTGAPGHPGSGGPQAQAPPQTGMPHHGPLGPMGPAMASNQGMKIVLTCEQICVNL